MRAKQHENDVINEKENTALAKHAKGCKHEFDFYNIKIVATENIQEKREILEVLEIQRDKNSCNFKTDTAMLNSMYKVLIS